MIFVLIMDIYFKQEKTRYPLERVLDLKDCRYKNYYLYDLGQVFNYVVVWLLVLNKNP